MSKNALLVRLSGAVLAAAVLGGGLSAPSFAEDRDHHDRRPVRHFHHAPPPAYGYGAPTYVQTPPALVYAPPSYASPFNLGLSFNIR
jgi:hypothetical protein